jgi:hypothetical protein
MSEMDLLVQAVAATLLLLGSAVVLWVVRATDYSEPELRPVAAAKDPTGQPERKAA